MLNALIGDLAVAQDKQDTHRVFSHSRYISMT